MSMCAEDGGNGLPPSANTARLALELAFDGPATVADVSTETGLPPRTARSGLNRLVDEGMAEKLDNEDQPNSPLYRLVEGTDD